MEKLIQAGSIVLLPVCRTEVKSINQDKEHYFITKRSQFIMKTYQFQYLYVK